MLNSPITAMVQPPTSRRQPAVDQVRRQVDGDERELEAAGEEAEHQQHVGAVQQRLRQCRTQRLRRARCAAPLPPVASASENGRISSIMTREGQQRLLPADDVDQRDTASGE